MLPRRLTPVHSPVTFGSIVQGGLALLGSESAAEGLTALLRETYGARKVLLLDSGTSALAVAMSACSQARSGLPVALPAFGCYDLATAADAADVGVRLYDVDPETLGPDFASLRRTLAEGVSAVVVAHLYGSPVDLEAVEECAREAGVEIVEDAAQGFGARFQGSPLGSWGAFGVLSFGRGKGITGGGGGALLCRNSEAVNTVQSSARLEGSRPWGVRELATAAALWALARPRLYWLPASLPFLALGETRYLPPHPPAPASRSALAIVRKNWAASLVEAEVRRDNGARLAKAIQRSRDVEPVRHAVGSMPSYLRFPVRVRDGAAGRLAGEAARRLGVMPGYPRPLPDLPGFAPRIAARHREHLGAKALSTSLFTLPTHSGVGPEALDAISTLIAGRAEGPVRQTDVLGCP